MESLYTNSYPLLYERTEEDPEKLGIYLGIGYDEDGFIQSGNLVFVNFHSTSFGFELTLKEDHASQISEHVSPKQILVVRGIPVEKFLSKPTIKFSIAELKTDGTEQYKSQKKKIKKQHFTSKGEYQAQLDLYLVPFLEFPWPESTKTGELKNYTKQISSTSTKKKSSQELDLHNPIKRAGFSDTLDLHAYALVDEPKDYTATEILILQLNEFEKFLDEAITIGFEKVTVVHGIGKGKLREEIFQILQKHPFVKEYKNEFHPKYKFGATEIYLQ